VRGSSQYPMDLLPGNALPCAPLRLVDNFEPRWLRRLGRKLGARVRRPGGTGGAPGGFRLRASPRPCPMRGPAPAGVPVPQHPDVRRAPPREPGPSPLRRRISSPRSSAVTASASPGGALAAPPHQLSALLRRHRFREPRWRPRCAAASALRAPPLSLLPRPRWRPRCAAASALRAPPPSPLPRARWRPRCAAASALRAPPPPASMTRANVPGLAPSDRREGEAWATEGGVAERSSPGGRGCQRSIEARWTPGRACIDSLRDVRGPGGQARRPPEAPTLPPRSSPMRSYFCSAAPVSSPAAPSQRSALRWPPQRCAATASPGISGAGSAGSETSSGPAAPCAG
jgi:hypothetical protein